MSTAYRHSFAADEDQLVTQVVPIAMPCRSIVGCSAPSVGDTGRCTAHQASRPVLAETPDQRMRRLARETAAIGAAYVERCTSVPAGAWS